MRFNYIINNSKFINEIEVIIIANKDKLNLSINEDLKKDFKHIAISENKTCSELVEVFIKAIKNNREIISVLEHMIPHKKKK